MTAIFLALAPVSGLALVATAAPAQAQQAEVSISLFFDQLSPHGRWTQHPRWGWVWYPTAVDANWRPYTQGRWVWTEQYGWYWDSAEQFGWATYHYGRWGYDEQYGWVWVPGDRWAPAWVAFRYSDQNIGWAPLPPETLGVNAAVEVDDSIMTAAYYQPRWVFVESRHFVDPRVFTYVAPPERNATFIRATVNITNIRVQNNVYVNRSFEPQRIRGAVGRDIPTVRVAQVSTYNNVNVRNRTDGNIVNVYNPRVRLDRAQAPPERARARDTDRPRATVRPELVRPEDRRNDRDRERDRDRATPGTTPGTPPSGQPERERATPGTPPAAPARPGQPPTQAQPDRDRDFDRAAPGAGPSRTPDRTPDRNARPEQPGTPKATPPQGAAPPTPPRGPNGRDDRNRSATPAQPATPPEPPAKTEPAKPAQPAQPPARVQPEDRRGAAPPTRPQPPAAAPAAPPSRAQPPAPAPRAQPPAPRAAPPAPAQRVAPPAPAAKETPKSEPEKKEKDGR